MQYNNTMKKHPRALSISLSLPVIAVMEREQARGVQHAEFVRDAMRRAVEDARSLGMSLDKWARRNYYNFPLNRGVRAFVEKIARTPEEQETLFHKSKAYRDFVAWHAGAIMEGERIRGILRSLLRQAHSEEAKTALRKALEALEGEHAAHA